MLDIQVVMTSEDGGKSITLNFQDTPKSEILEIIEVLKEFDYELDHSSEDLTTDDDDEGEIIFISFGGDDEDINEAFDFLEKILGE